MENKVCKHDIILILISSFFYMSSPMLVTPLITGYSESLGASAAMIGIIGGMLYGNVNIIYFYPILAVTVPIGLLVHWLNRCEAMRA